MRHSSVVRARIDEHIKDEASAVLKAIGLTRSDAFRMMMTRIARAKALPLVPNAETVAAMREARRGKLPRFADADADALMTDLMRTVERTPQFRRDYKWEMKGRHRTTLQAESSPIRC